MKGFFFIGLFLISGLLLAQYPTADFTLPASVCQDGLIEVTNNSLNADSYAWDLCFNSLSNPVSGEAISGISGMNYSQGVAAVYSEDSLLVILTNTFGHSLSRLSISAETGLVGTTEDLGNFGVISSPYAIDIERNSINEYYAFVTTLSGNILRFYFGSSLRSTPTVVDLGNLSTWDDLYGIDVVESSSGEWYIIVSSGGNDKLSVVSLGTSLSTIPTAMDVTDLGLGSDDLTEPRGISVMEIDGQWYGLLSDYLDLEVVRLTFGTSLLSTPVVDRIGGFSWPTELELIKDGGEYFGLVADRVGGVYTYSFGDDITNTPEELDAGNFGIMGGGTFSLSSVKRSDTEWSILATNRGSNQLYHLSYQDNCNGEVTSNSTSQDLPSFSTDSVDHFFIELTAYNASGNLDRTTKSFEVLNQSAPVVSIITSSLCVSSISDFSLDDSSGILSYSWDLDGDGTEDSTNPTPSFDYSSLGPGDYNVSLHLADNTCDRLVQQQITIYPDPPTPTFTAPNSECQNTLVSFVNTTDESAHTGVISYEWDFNGEGNSFDKNPSFEFLTAGTKSVTLKTIIPGCEEISTPIQIEIQNGPTAAFTSSSFSVCEGESISFTDQSTNGPVSWSWDFDDGFTSTSQSPNHLFSTPGNYDVALTVLDAAGCQHTHFQEVSVSSIPVVSFDFDVPCTSSEGIQFMDLSTVSGADIVSRNWYIGDTPLTEVQNQQNPLLNFEAEGTVNVRLETVSSTGCESSHSEDIQILVAPQPDFSMNIGCEGELSSFTDVTLSPGNQITSRLWTLDGVNYTTEEIDHTFSGPGVFEVTLEVTGQNFCSETITKEIEVLELLTVDFSVDGDCSNELIELSDQSTVLQDPIVSREWSLDGTSVGNGSSLTLESLPDNTYELTLEVTTASGCVVNTTNNIVINRAPQSAMTSPKTFGVPGDNITFTNVSTGGSSHQWLFNGNFVSNNEVDETFEFTDPGTYQVSIVADNDLGCSDTTTTSVLIAVPVVDLSIGQFEVVENEGKGTIFLEIQNNSNLPIDDTEVVIELENQFSVTEQITSEIGIGESQLVSLNIGVPLNSNELSYLCVSLNSQYNGFDDNNPLDNEKCIAIEPRVVVEAPFPNPVSDQVRLRLVAPSGGSTIITLLNSAGKVEMVHAPQTHEGLNNFFLDLKALTTGVYFIRIEISGVTSIQRIIKL